MCDEARGFTHDPNLWRTGGGKAGAALNHITITITICLICVLLSWTLPLTKASQNILQTSPRPRAGAESPHTFPSSCSLCLTMGRVSLTATTLFSLAAAADFRDLHRARTKVPRPPFKGRTSHEMGTNLNAALKRMFPNTRPCEEWSVEELQAYQEQLYQHRHEELDTIYKSSTDNRRLLHESLAAYRQHWADVNALYRITFGTTPRCEMKPRHVRMKAPGCYVAQARIPFGRVQKHSHLDLMHRDGHCHEAVMWLVHHVPVEAQQTIFANQMAPLLPLSDHLGGGGCGPDATVSEVRACLLNSEGWHVIGSPPDIPASLWAVEGLQRVRGQAVMRRLP